MDVLKIVYIVYTIAKRMDEKPNRHILAFSRKKISSFCNIRDTPDEGSYCLVFVGTHGKM